MMQGPDYDERLQVLVEKYKFEKYSEFEHRVVQKRNVNMKNISINIPIAYDDCIQDLIKAGIVPSRSEAIRNAVRDFLDKEILFFRGLQGR